MPGRRGMHIQQPGLTPAQRAALERMVDEQGMNEGVHTTYHRVRHLMGANAPTRDEVGEFLNPRPHFQQNRMVKKNRTVAPMIPRGTPLSLVAMDTYYLAGSWHRMPNNKIKTFRACIVVIDTLTKFVHVKPVEMSSQLQDARPLANQAVEALQEFLDRARNEANDQDLHPERILSDRGSEFVNATMDAWINVRSAANPGFYQRVLTTNSKSHSNSVAERVVQTIRRYTIGMYKAFKRDWDENDVPAQARNFDIVQHQPEITRRYNTKYHRIIKGRPIDAIRPNTSPTYAECLERIREYARKKYGGRATDSAIPAFSSAGPLTVNDLVRIKVYKGGSGTARLTWDKIGKSSADNWSESLYRIAQVNQGRGWTESTYLLQDMDGNMKQGKYDRTNVLKVPEATLEFVDDESEEEEDEDPDEPDDEPELPPDPRPNNPAGHRYKIGDKLQFDEGWFEGVLGGLENNPVDRIGTVERTYRETRGQRRYLYAIRFQPEGTLVDRLPRADIDTDDEVHYVQ